jgi:hypothetical protein
MTARRGNGEAITARLERLRANLTDVVEHLEEALHGAQVALVEVEAELHVTRRRPPLNSKRAPQPSRKEATAE